MRHSRFYKHDERGYFQKKRWPLMEFYSQKISSLHSGFHHSPGRGAIAVARWDGKTGNGTMHIFDVRGCRLVQVRVIVGGYIAEMLCGKQAEDFDSVWWHKLDQLS